LPNVLRLLHSLFNEYSERQINTDRTAVKGEGGGGRGSVERGEPERRGRDGRVWRVKGRRRRSSRFGAGLQTGNRVIDPSELLKKVL